MTNLFVRVRDLQSIRKTLTGRPRGLPCDHFGGQSSPVATPDAQPPGKGCDEWKEAKGNLVLLTRVSGSVELLFIRTFTRWDILWPSARLAGVFRTAIVPDEPIRAKGAGWRNFSPTLHFRRHPTNPLVAPLLRIFKLGATFAPLPSLASLQPRSSASAIGGSVEGLDNPTRLGMALRPTLCCFGGDASPVATLEHSALW